MPKPYCILTLITTLLFCSTLVAQNDSAIAALQQIPAKYISTVDKKIDQYTSRVSRKTIKTLEKLSRWETRVKTTLLKVNPEAAGRLFTNDQLTFASLLQKIKQGEEVALQYHAQYDKYRDDLTTSMKYLEQQKEELDEKVLGKVKTAKVKLQQLNAMADSTEAIQDFIKERKKELVNGAFQYIGNSKYLSKINKEVFYYAETMKNYKELFSDEEKMEQMVKGILNKIPLYQKFAQQNSMVATIFGSPGGVAANLAGLQTRAGIQDIIQERIVSGGPNAQLQISQNIQAAQAQLNQLKDKVLNTSLGSGTGEGSLPDFKPNMQKTKSFKQRLEYGANIQFAKNNTLMPTAMDVALTVGYKLNDKSVAGVGASYKLGLGTIDRIRFTNQGLSLRSFMDWKLKRQFFISGGMEMNYLSDLPASTTIIKYANHWQQSALLGVSKKIGVKSKWFKETKLQLLYDFLAKQHLPVSQPVLFRVGYNF